MIAHKIDIKPPQLSPIVKLNRSTATTAIDFSAVMSG